MPSGNRDEDVSNSSTTTPTEHVDSPCNRTLRYDTVPSVPLVPQASDEPLTCPPGEPCTAASLTSPAIASNPYTRRGRSLNQDISDQLNIDFTTSNGENVAHGLHDIKRLACSTSDGVNSDDSNTTQVQGL